MTTGAQVMRSQSSKTLGHKRLPLFIWLLLIVVAFPAAAQDENYKAVELGNDVILVVGPAGNTLVAVDQDGLFLIDGVSEQYASSYLEFVREFTGVGRIKGLILTHWHADVAGLNAALGQDGVPIYSHENTKQWLATTIRDRGDVIIHQPVNSYALPTQTFYENFSIPFRGGSIELGYMLQAHTDGDLYVYFPEQNILFTGSAIRSDMWAIPDLATNGFIGGIVDAYGQILGLINQDTVVVPGSGTVLMLDEVRELSGLYKNLMEILVAQLRKRMSVDEVLALNLAENMKSEWKNSEEFIDRGFRSLYSHLRETRHVGIMP